MKTKRVREMRSDSGLNQSDFWKRVGITQSGGSRYESGRRVPKPVELLLCVVYGNAAEKLAARQVMKGWEA